MKAHQDNALTTLTLEEIQRVGGSGGLNRKELRAQDMYGNTVSIEEFMDRQLAAAKTGDASLIWDFYSEGYNSNKPNIYFP